MNEDVNIAQFGVRGRLLCQAQSFSQSNGSSFWEADVMHMRVLERAKQRWEFAADSMPQLICIVDGEGRVLHANRTLERWGLGEVEWVHGVHLHDLLHPCCDEACYLASFWRDSSESLARRQRAERDVWDPVLAKYLRFRVQLPVDEPIGEAGTDDFFYFFAVVSIEDVTSERVKDDKSRRATQILCEQVEQEEAKRAEAERLQSRLGTIMDKTPAFTAMADHTGTLFYLNPAARELLGINLEDKLDRLSLRQWQQPEGGAQLLQEAMPAAERDGVWSGDTLLLARDGREVRVQLTVIAHRGESGALEGYSLLGRDMSEWLRTEEALQLAQTELWRLSAQHLTVQEGERRRIAADLHDGLGQTLSLVKLAIEEAARSAKTGATGKVAATLERLAPTVKLALSELRRMSMNLRPSTLDDLGIVATLSWYFREFEAACPLGVRVEHEVSVAEAEVPNLLKITIFRIVQEATGNALKHAHAACIRVALHRHEDALELVVEDDGRGFDPAAAATDFQHGLGLQSMRERAQLSGGSYELRAAAGAGTCVRVRWTADRLAATDGPAARDAPADEAAGRAQLERYSQCLACSLSARSD